MDRRARQPDAVAEMASFNAFYDVSVRELFRYFQRATAGDRRLAEDLVQETFMACVRAYRSGQPDALTMPWLIGVGRHKLIDHFRKRAREDRKLTLAYSAGSGAESDSALDELSNAQAVQLLDGLSPAHRIVLMLRYVDDLAVSEVARLMGSSVRATESLLVRARHALEVKLREVRDA